MSQLSNATTPSQVAILAGGQGTRLQTRAGNLPKPMVPIMGKPVLQHQIELCREHGFFDIALLVHYRHEAISEKFGDGAQFGVRIRYEVEAVPRGTAGALRDALPRLANRFLLLYGDTYMDVDLGRLWKAHATHGASATLFLHPNDHPQDSDLVDVDRDGAVRAIRPYPHPAGVDYRNLVNAALYVLEREALAEFTLAEGKADIAKHMFPAMLAAGKRLHGYISPEYIKDMGTPERLDKVERDIEAGLPEHLSGRSLRSAVFLDRDGTINEEVNHLRQPSQLVLLEGSGEAIRRINRAGKLAVVVTNQPVVARGDVSFDELDQIHARLETLLGERGAYLDALYVCPHHPDKGFDGEVAALKVECRCRKPAPGMIDNACRDLSVARPHSWMIGDTTSDIEAGRRAGLRTILVQTGHAGRDDKHPLRADYVAADLVDATSWILDGHQMMQRRLAPVVTAALDGRLLLVGGLARSGKSRCAQVLKELITEYGRTAHVVSLDSWLKPIAERPEGEGVLERYDMAVATAQLLSVVESASRRALTVPTYDRVQRKMHRLPITMSVGADDLLIVEGVPALLSQELVSAAATTVHVELPESNRIARMKADYRWRGHEEQIIDALIESRSRDEKGLVQAAAQRAEYVVSSQLES